MSPETIADILYNVFLITGMIVWVAAAITAIVVGFGMWVDAIVRMCGIRKLMLEAGWRILKERHKDV